MILVVLNLFIVNNILLIFYYILLFNLNYLDLFKCYYNDQKQIDKISICDQIITLSKKTQKKTFYELLIKNKNIKRELINAVKDVYFNGKDPNCPMMGENRIESK